MVEVQALHLPPPISFNSSCTLKSEAESDWKGISHQQKQDWRFGSSQLVKEEREGTYVIKEEFGDKYDDYQARPFLPYPSPQSQHTRLQHQSMTIGGPMPSKHSGHPTSLDYKPTGSRSNAALDDIVHARQQVANQHATRASSKPASPVFQSSSQGGAGGHLIVSYLQLPSTITKSQGSLSEFAAQLTCLFWFESSATVAKIENADYAPMLSMTFIPEAYPATGFMKWVTTILSTTQVTQNVILLALLFIYRLKKQCPNVKGKLGSEYRLLTVALMLGNKFLDDNTYTNKTWAEVSGISVHEIHVMEVEFLSHMKYDLYTSKEQWDRWHQRLSKFWNCFNQAARKQKDLRLADMGRSQQNVQPLPSPPASTHASPPYIPSVSPSTTTFSNMPLLPPYPTTLEHYPKSNGRKRSHDADAVEPPAKRPSVQTSHAYSLMSQPSHPQLPILPVPNKHSPNSQHSYGNPRALMAFQPVPSAGRSTTPTGPYLPPVNWLAGVSSTIPQAQAQHATPGTTGSDRQARHRSNSNASLAMARTTSNGGYSSTSTVPGTSSVGYSSTAGVAPSSTYTTTSTDSHPSITPPAMAQHIYNPAPSHSSTSTPHHSVPGQSTHPGPMYASAASHSLPPNQLSPSHFLTSRSSPYRPVRHMSTLLVPPPSGSIQHHPAQIPQEQMRWQPLGKNNVDERSGRVPYLHREAWPQTHQFNQWPSL